MARNVGGAVGILFTDSSKIHQIAKNSGIIALEIKNFLYNYRKDLIQRNYFF